MKIKIKIMSLFLFTSLVLTSFIGMPNIVVNAATAKYVDFIAANTNNMTQTTWVKLETDTAQKWELKRSVNKSNFNCTYTDLLTNESKIVNTPNMYLGSLTGLKYNSNTKAINDIAEKTASGANNIVTVYGSTNLKVTTNAKNVKTKCYYNPDNLSLAVKHQTNYDLIIIKPLRISPATITIKFIESNSTTRSVKLNLRVLNSNETINVMNKYGTYKSFEKDVTGATAWAAAKNVYLWEDYNCTKPKNLNVKVGTDSTGKDIFKTTNCLYVKKNNNTEDYLRFYIDHDTKNKLTISGNKMYVKVYDAKLKKSIHGYVNDSRVFINMPDIIPSIDYTRINSVSSPITVSGVSVPGLTGKALANRTAAVPIKISTARLIQRAQNVAKRYGFTISIAEAYRSLSTQSTIVKSLNNLLKTAYITKKSSSIYKPVRYNLTSFGHFINNKFRIAKYGTVTPYKMTDQLINCRGNASILSDDIGWYISIRQVSSGVTGPGQHQAGRAIDCTLKSYATKKAIVTQCEIQDMSAQALITNNKIIYNAGEKAMNRLFTKQGMTGLISEWWHFEELITKETAKLYNTSTKTAYSKTYSYSDINAHDAAIPNLGNLQCSYKL